MALPEGKGRKGTRKRKGEQRKRHLFSSEVGAPSGPVLPEHLPSECWAADQTVTWDRQMVLHERNPKRDIWLRRKPFAISSSPSKVKTIDNWSRNSVFQSKAFLKHQLGIDKISWSSQVHFVPGRVGMGKRVSNTKILSYIMENIKY